MGIGDDFGIAFAKSNWEPMSPFQSKEMFLFQSRIKINLMSLILRVLENLGFKILATGGTQRFLIENGISVERVNKVLEGRPHVVDSMNNNNINLVINTTEGSKALSDSKSLRQAALRNRIPTTQHYLAH